MICITLPKVRKVPFPCIYVELIPSLDKTRTECFDTFVFSPSAASVFTPMTFLTTVWVLEGVDKRIHDRFKESARPGRGVCASSSTPSSTGKCDGPTHLVPCRGCNE